MNLMNIERSICYDKKSMQEMLDKNVPTSLV